MGNLAFYLTSEEELEILEKGFEEDFELDESILGGDYSKETQIDIRIPF